MDSEGEVVRVAKKVVTNGVKLCVSVVVREGETVTQAVDENVATPLLAPGVSVTVTDTDNEGDPEGVEWRVLGRGESVTERVGEREGD